jgi:SAM-dependent methyltransferase
VPRRRPSVHALWQGIGTQLRRPSGLWGRMVGSAMAFANAKPNAMAIAALGLREGESVLEVGCGPGRALQALLRSPQLKQAIGLDWSEIMLAQASRRNRPALEAGCLALVRGDFAQLPFGDELADAILAVNVVYFMGNSAALREARRVLRPGGRIVLYATDGSAMQNWPFAGPDTHRLFDADRLAALLVDAGFAADRIRIDSVDAGFGVRGLLAVAQKENAECYCCPAALGDVIDDDGKSRCWAQPSSASSANSAKYLMP